MSDAVAEHARNNTMIQRQTEQWQLDEGSAEAYERYLVPLLFAPGAEYLIELATPGPGERVLDVACGTGIVARRAALRVGSGGKVVGLDLNEGMLGMASKASSDIRPVIEWRQGDATSMPLPDGAFDVVLCQQGLQFFLDQPAALGEMRRVLTPNGRLALSVLRSLEHNPGYHLLADALEQHLGPEAGAMMRSPFPSLSREELRDLIAGAGFRDVRIFLGIGPVRYPTVEEFVRWEGASSPLAGPIGALKEDVRAALIRDLGEALRIYTDDAGIVFPTETYLAVAR
ncbi:MAG TPA: methyltransferase domain-containing protein [Rubrobacteraceae bacterium]|nr:methyltransferase domain-containing protein [Rubrobacteraceae bacterium]